MKPNSPNEDGHPVGSHADPSPAVSEDKGHAEGTSAALSRDAAGEPGSAEPPRSDGLVGDALLGQEGSLRRKDAQRCHQAVEAIGLALATSADPVLREVIVARVDPAPDAGRLRVSVYTDGELDADELSSR